MKKEIAIGAIVIVVIVAIMIQTSTKDNNKEVKEISYNRINIEQQDTNESEEMEESGVENTDNQSNTEENNGEQQRVMGKLRIMTLQRVLKNTLMIITYQMK